MTDTVGKTPRSTVRPASVKPPAHWTGSPPPPEPKAVSQKGKKVDDRNPVRYGDWELNGIAIDF